MIVIKVARICCAMVDLRGAFPGQPEKTKVLHRHLIALIFLQFILHVR